MSPPIRRRAPGMSPEERRAMIVAAAPPLVAAYGGAVTTGQVTRAAGIGEATIFRAFADKDEVLDACVADAVSPGHVQRELASIDVAQPLADRLTDAAGPPARQARGRAPRPGQRAGLRAGPAGDPH
ncbi:TetR family transcriptional regulator [Streptomyces sp. NPDC016845]|uniref:TetR family transcriptional regulator n=1 Tax=Streptomyces sp. NPDC016845 TaxID=3364972 RepID=UPI00379C76E1